MKSDPEDMIEDLREQARTDALEVFPHVRIEETLAWEAADWIRAALPVLKEIGEREGDGLAKPAKDLVAGVFERTPEDEA